MNTYFDPSLFSNSLGSSRSSAVALLNVDQFRLLLTAVDRWTLEANVVDSAKKKASAIVEAQKKVCPMMGYPSRDVGGQSK